MATLSPAPPVAGRLLIGGDWQSPSGARFESRSPSRQDEVVGVFPAATAAEADAAVAAARRAYPGWRRTSRIHRAELFDTLAQLVKRDTDALAELMARESPFMGLACTACADACKTCAEECTKHDDPQMKECATACKACETSCRTMASHLKDHQHHTG